MLCKLHQVVGQWRFVFDNQYVRKGSVGQFNSEHDYWDRLSCGRHQPVTLVQYTNDQYEPQLDTIYDIQREYGSELSEADVTELDFVLTDDGNLAYQSGVDGHSGMWTLVVHEGMQAFINTQLPFYDGMVSFDTFWRYNNIGSDTYESICSETMVGWYHTMAGEGMSEDDELWGCFYGVKYGEDTEEHVVFNHGSPQFDNTNEEDVEE